MPVLTYAGDLGDAVQVGQPLGCDAIYWPYRVEDVDVVQVDETGRMQTLVTVEPWPIPGPGASDEEKAAAQGAMLHAADRVAGVIR